MKNEIKKNEENSNIRNMISWLVLLFQFGLFVRVFHTHTIYMACGVLCEFLNLKR